MKEFEWDIPSGVGSDKIQLEASATNARSVVSTSAGRKILACLMIVLFLPLIIVVASAIMICGQKPIFYQERVGFRGKTFPIRKFRTVWDDHAAIVFSTESRRKRFSFIARVLRSTGLDEIPQLFNVVRGEMAFIGPRPLTPADYAALPPGRDLRLLVLPGLTGLAQVNGGQALGAGDKLAFDFYYVQRRSLRLDLYILARTVLRLVRGQCMTRGVHQPLHSAANTLWAEVIPDTQRDRDLAA